MTRVAATPVKAIDTTGAGDAFVGAFGFGLAAGFDELIAVRLGIACASDEHGAELDRHTSESTPEIFERFSEDAQARIERAMFIDHMAMD